MSAAEFVALWACVDCYMYAAGISEHERGEPYSAAVLGAAERMSRDNGGARCELLPSSSAEQHAPDCDAAECECETIDFSWSRCECCLSALGGSRHAMTLVIGGEQQ